MTTIRTTKQPTPSSGSIRFSAKDGKNEVGHVYLYLIWNDAHKKPYGFVEDLAVNEEARGRGIARALMDKLEAKAKRERCYKLIANSNPTRKAARALYLSLGYRSHGTEFRLDLK